MEPFILTKRFSEVAEANQDKIALQIRTGKDEYRRVTYKEAIELSKKVGYFFIFNKGIKKGDKIALLLENRPEWPIFYFGILFSGATAVPLDPQLSEFEVKNILADCEARLLIKKSNIDEFLNSLADFPSGFIWPRISINDIASILYTSGTTALPKGVMLSHRNFSSNFNSVATLGICSSDDNILSILPLHHSYPFMVTLLLPLFLGAQVTYISSLKAEEITAAMRETGVTILVGVPQLYYLFYKGITEKLKSIPLPVQFFLRPFIAKKVRAGFGRRLRFLASGGARLDPVIASGLARFGLMVLEGYGLTETSPIVSFNPPKRQRFGSVGLPIPDVEVKILDPDENGIGEILIKGKNVMEGYYRRPLQTEEVIKDEWFYTGDLGYIDKDGYLFITGRKKEVIVLSSGKNIYPDEVESFYLKSPFIKELCVLQVEMDGVLEGLGAVIVPDMEYFKKSRVVNIREKLKWELDGLSKQLPSFKRIIKFVIAKDDLPRTRLGKLKRYEILERYKEAFRTLTPEQVEEKETKQVGVDVQGRGILQTDIGRQISDFLKRELNLKRELRPDDHLELDLGIDSLGRVELAVGLEKRFDIQIPEELMSQIFTVKDVVHQITELVLKKTHGLRRPLGVIDDTHMWRHILDEMPSHQTMKRIDIHPNFFTRLLTFLVCKIMYGIFFIIFLLRIKGKDRIPKRGPFILCPNHTSYLDAFVVAVSVPVRCECNLFFLGYQGYFDQPIIRDAIRLMRVIPIDPATHLLEAMVACSFVLKAGKGMCIFPEGQRQIDGRLGIFKQGVGILAKELNIPLVPVYIEGAFESWPRGRLFPKPHPIYIAFGEAIAPDKLIRIARKEGEGDIGDYEAIVKGLKQKIERLKDEVAR